MSVLIESAPDNISFSKNCIKLGLISEEYLMGSGEVFAKITIGINDYLQAGEQFVLVFTDEEGNQVALTFTAVDAPILGAYQVPTQATAPLTLLQYSNYLIGFLRANPLFSTYYTVSLDTIGLKLEFELRVPAYSLFWNDSSDALQEVGSGNYYEALEVRENYKILADVYMRPNIIEPYEHLTTLEAKPNEVAKATLEISELLNAAFENYIQTLDINLATFIGVSEMIGKYYIKLSDIYGDPPEIQDINYDVIEFAFKFGGQYDKDWNLDTNFFKAQSSFAKWLTSFPDPMIVGENQRQFLSYYKTYEKYAHKITWYYRDDNFINSSEIAITNESPLKNVITTEVGFSHLVNLIGAYDPDNVVYYDYKIVEIDALNVHHEKLIKRFIVDRNHYENIRDYYYLNRFGCIEVFRATGIHAKTLSTKREECVSIKCGAGNNIQGNTHQYSHSSTMSIIGRSGILLNPSDIESLVDFMHGEYIWLHEPIENEEGIFHPIKLTDKKFKLSEDKKNIQELKFKYQYSINPVDH